jgi:hypothetical protein
MLAQNPTQFLIQGLPGSLLAAVRWPGLEARQLLSIYDIVPGLRYMMLYLQPSICYGVMLNKTQAQTFSIIHVLYYITSCHVMSCCVVSCRIVSCRAVSSLTLSYRIMSYHIVSSYIISYITSRHVMLCHVMSIQVTWKLNIRPGHPSDIIFSGFEATSIHELFYVPHTNHNLVLNTGINLLLYLVKLSSISCWPLDISRNWVPAANASTKV